MSFKSKEIVAGQFADTRANTIQLLIRQLRPKQWTKNLLLFAALLFSFQHMNAENIVKSTIAFILFCFVSGTVYIMNDYVDREADRHHETKRFRPMASGQLNPQLALMFGGTLLVGSLLLSLFLEPLFSVVLFIYFIINMLYSLVLKHVVIIDIMLIAAGFVLRALAGGLVINVPFTPWFLLCTMLLSLFLAIGKRRHELILMDTNSEAHRKVLSQYSVALLDQLIGIVAASTIICYSLFTFTSGRTIHLMWTIPFVVYGIFRYLYLIHMEQKGGAPDRVLLEDKPIMITVILYVIVSVIIMAVFE
ncbi:decaprenyl-phosphate phosphoribosyltransferase [Paenibacillus sp. GSMTC-2017]|uniref:decaprenyl-phosphate phosphoribosyltransferase n=1 Tax=Paenibacillus sp. GSMTC-2017 TaxID=2794350 RepID=UPI0018D98FB3|nr:decaprenyl-phosphate phosphoribosyltransferase [Paenibacillus sp. GSMTC-2017]MBH5317727.1 decaprenyl-phosphate phosphoribosyltransferase [Paenibacillus sp. GSMTC-2017]